MNQSEIQKERDNLKKMQDHLDSVAIILQSFQTVEDAIRDTQQKYIEEGEEESDAMEYAFGDLKEDIIDRYMLANEQLAKFQSKYTL